MQLIPNHETVTWKVHNVSELLQNNAWPAYTIMMEVGLGVHEVSKWTISLQTRNKNTLLCARTMLQSPQEPHRRVTHLLKVAVVMAGGEEAGPVYFFPNDNPTNSNTRSASSNNPSPNNNASTNNNNSCMSMKSLRRLLFKTGKLDVDDELGDGSTAKEAKPGHKGHPSLWKIAPLDKIIPDEDDSIELKVTLTVFGSHTTDERL